MMDEMEVQTEFDVMCDAYERRFCELPLFYLKINQGMTDDEIAELFRMALWLDTRVAGGGCDPTEWRPGSVWQVLAQDYRIKHGLEPPLPPDPHPWGRVPNFVGPLP